MASTTRSELTRRVREFQLIGRDPVLMVGLLVSVSFVFIFVVWPLLRVVMQGFFAFETGALSAEYFQRYLDPYYARHNWNTLRDTMIMGLSTATGGTLLGFIVAFTLVRCRFPFKRVSHALSLIPTISPPFAIAIAVILLFGRAGLVTKDWLGMTFPRGSNDIYGLDGLVLVQIITFFPVAYLIIRAMLERLDPSMEEAAQSLGASKLHILRTVTLPLLLPGFAGSFLLLFVELLADLGNPLLLTGTANVLSTEIYLAVAGEYNQQKAAALSLVLLIPTLTVFIVQRYWVSRRSYVSVTGKPTGGQIQIDVWYVRWPFIILTTLCLLLVTVLYLSIAVGSFTRLWGIDYTFTLANYRVALERGMEAILDTTFLSAVATPIAGVLGMIVAYLVVRRKFSGKEGLDFVSNLGAAVPGTILGIGFIIAFIKPPLIAIVIIFLAFLYYLLSNAKLSRSRAVAALGLGLIPGLALARRGYRVGRGMVCCHPCADSDPGAGRRGPQMRVGPIQTLGHHVDAPRGAGPLPLRDRALSCQCAGHMGPLAGRHGCQDCYQHGGLDRRVHPGAAAGLRTGVDRPGRLHHAAACTGSARACCRAASGRQHHADLCRIAPGPGWIVLHYPGRLCSAQPAGVVAGRRRFPATDRPGHRGGINLAGRGRAAHLPPDHVATDRACLPGRPDLRLCPTHDLPQRHHLPDDAQMAHLDGADPERGGAGRTEHCHRLCHDRHLHRAGGNRAVLPCYRTGLSLRYQH